MPSYLLRLAVVFGLGFSMILACDHAPQTLRGQDRRQLRIVLVGEAKDSPTWPILTSAAARFESLYPFVKVQTMATQSGSPREQQLLLEGLLQDNVHAIGVMPIDSMAIRSAIDQLVNNGRPVVTIGRDVPTSDRAVFCGPAESEIGRSAAAACGLALVGRSQTAMVLHAGTDHEVFRGRYFAFKEELPIHGNIRLLGEVDCQGSPLEAVRLIRQRTRLYPRVGCWVFLEDWALQHLRAGRRLLPLGCAMVLCNGSPKYFERVRKGEIRALVTFDLYRAVQDALQTASILAEGTTSQMTKIIATPTEIITDKELDGYARRWEAWQQGRPSPEEVSR